MNILTIVLCVVTKDLEGFDDIITLYGAVQIFKSPRCLLAHADSRTGARVVKYIPA